jgi:hypothetical protein
LDTQSNVAPGGGEGAPAPAVVTPASDATYSGASAAGRELAALRWKRDNPEEQAAPVEAAAEELPSDGQEAAQPETVDPGETTDQQSEPEVELPPIEPPRSWTKEEKEEFASYPREAQEKIARREQERESALRRGQNEAAEKLKGLTAKEQAAEQARQQYEAALPALLQSLSEEMQGEFADVKTLADVNRLAAEDPFRFAKYQAKQMQVAAIQREAQQAQERQSQEYRQQWSAFASKEDQTFADKVPEMADPAKAKQIADSAVSVLHDHGFTDQELAKLWNGEASISLRDHRLQLLIRDAVRLRDAQKVAAKPAPKPVPQVQRPGVAQARASSGDAQIQALQKRFDETGSAKDAAALLNAKRAKR